MEPEDRSTEVPNHHEAVWSTLLDEHRQLSDGRFQALSFGY
jgi:hypothetical protein